MRWTGCPATRTTSVLLDAAEQASARLEFVTERFEDSAIGRFIVGARAFIGGVEREKIAERTMRGKAERARSGKLPQGTGKGCYGYRYHPATGHRTIVENQALVVWRIFAEFIAGSSTMRIADNLNAASIPTLMGSRWQSATIHRLLGTETYTGKTIYRRTKTTWSRNPKTGRKSRQVMPRDEQEWIEIPDVTPAIIDEATFITAKTRLNDPERRRQAQRKHSYLLSGRTRCIMCGHAAVGQTLRGPKLLRYYRCRSAFAGPSQERCDSRYIRADKLEAAVVEAASVVVTDPDVVLEQMRHYVARGDNTADAEGVQQQIDELMQRLSRLRQLYEWGDIGPQEYRQKVEVLDTQHRNLTKRLNQATSEGLQLPPLPDVSEACKRVGAWVQNIQGEDVKLLLDALSTEVYASRDTAEIRFLIPNHLQGNSHAHVRPVVSKEAGYPFRISFQIPALTRKLSS